MSELTTEFYKKPSFIALVIMLIGLLILPFFEISEGKRSFSASSFQCLVEGGDISGDMKPERKAEAVNRFWEYMDKGNSGLGFLEKASSILILLCLYLIYIGWKGTNETTIFKAAYIKPIKMALLVICCFYFLRYSIGIGLDARIKEHISPSLGLWASLLASIFIQFEDKIMAQFKPAPKTPEQNPS